MPLMPYAILTTNASGPETLIRRLPPLMVAFAAFCITLYTVLPGGMSVDSIQQLQQATAGVYTDWHPPVMSWLWRQLNRIHYGPASIVTLHCLLYWVSVTIIGLQMIESTTGRILFILGVGCFPANLVQIGTVWKDTSLTCFGLFSVALLLAASRLPLASRRRSVCILLAGVSLVYLCGVRHNGLFAVPPLVLFGLTANLLSRETRTRIFLTIAITLAIALCGKTWNALLARGESSHLHQVIAFHDLMGISLRVRKNLIPPEYLTESSRTLEALEENYIPADAAKLFWNKYYPHAPSRAPIDVLTKAWLRAIIEHPMAYLSHRWAAFASLLDTNIHDHSLKWFEREDTFGFHARQTVTRDWLIRMLDTINGTFLGKGWMYVLLCMICLLCAPFVRNRPWPRLLALCLSASGLCFALGYFFIVPCSDFRYLYWTATCSAFSSAALASVAASRVLSIMNDRWHRARSTLQPER